ncbi:hypothetical protein [Kitasatospora sp. NPDC051914]|uniref:hypothetical protein n=1 Tax=Kitasatospora sp. NPDC051914 TaxID=3154945 RepID=UPI0034141150
MRNDRRHHSRPAVTMREAGSPKDHSTGSLVLSTIILQGIALSLWAVIALAAWPFGLWPGYTPAAMTTVMFGGHPSAELYRAAPPRRRPAAVLALAVLVASGVLTSTVTELLLPGRYDAEELGHLIGFLVGTPVGAAVFSWTTQQPPVPGPVRGPDE